MWQWKVVIRARNHVYCNDRRFSCAWTGTHPASQHMANRIDFVIVTGFYPLFCCVFLIKLSRLMN